MLDVKEDYTHCCRYCKNFDRANDRCFSNEIYGGSDYADKKEVFDDGYVVVANPESFYCSAWE